MLFTDPYGLCPDNLAVEPCLPGAVIFHNFPGRLETGTSSNETLNRFAVDAAATLQLTVVVGSGDRRANPTGSGDGSPHRIDVRGAGALDLHLFRKDGSLVPDRDAAQMLKGVRDATGAGVRIIRDKPGTCTSGPHIHIDTRTDQGDRAETACQYEPTTDFN